MLAKASFFQCFVTLESEGDGLVRDDMAKAVPRREDACADMRSFRLGFPKRPIALIAEVRRYYKSCSRQLIIESKGAECA